PPPDSRAPLRRNPICGTFPVGAVSAASGTASIPLASETMNVRRFIAGPPPWPQAGGEAEESGQGVDPTPTRASVSAFGLPAALLRHLHLGPGGRAPATVGRRRVLRDQALVAALDHLRSRVEAVVGEPSRRQEQVLAVEHECARCDGRDSP